ncbi:MAG: hypothetical protein IPL26_13220 [Leptospiraceae bacterium]|nr:hypothetical protein [Leptospiraceae bacterium]
MLELTTKNKDNTNENLFYFCEFKKTFSREVIEIKPMDDGAKKIIDHIKKFIGRFKKNIKNENKLLKIKLESGSLWDQLKKKLFKS